MKDFMHKFKLYILSALFAIGLLISPTVSFEERVDVAIKFESGLLIKAKDIFGSVDTIISLAKNNSKTNLEFLLSERRNIMSKLDDTNLDYELCFSYDNNPFNKYSYYFSRNLQRYKVAKSIYQLSSLLL